MLLCYMQLQESFHLLVLFILMYILYIPPSLYYFSEVCNNKMKNIEINHFKAKLGN